LLADYKKAVITAFSDVDKALAALKLFAVQEELTRQSLVASRKAYDLSEQRLNSGIIDVVTLLQTEQTLFTTQDSLVQVRLSRLTEAVALYQALGGAYAVKSKSGT
jgi:outer membrane protein TolC